MASRSSSKTDVATTSPTEHVKTELAANTQPVSSNISTRETTSGDMATNEKAVDIEAPAAEEQLPSAPGMEPWRQSLILVGLLLSAVLMALDGTMITTAIPVITKDFDSVHDIGWYGSVYYLALVLAQPVLGSLFFQLNSRYVFWSAILVFEIGSIVAATAKASYILIIGRAIAGAGGAGLFSGALIIANFIATDDKKPVYVGMISSCFGLGSAVGPLIGGAFTDSDVTWRFCFWLSLPVGFVSFICTIFYSPPSLPGPPWYKAILGLDWAGLGLLTSSLVLLLFALQLGGTTYAWNDSVPIGLLVGFAISLILFLCWQFFTKNANHILSARILKIRTVSAAAISELFFVFGVQIQLYYLPIYLQVVKGSSPLLSGVELIPYLGAMAVSPIISGILTAKTRMYQPFLWFGLGIFVVGAGLFYAITPTSTLGFVIGGQILAGFGVGICMQTIITAIQSSVQPQDIPLGTGLHVFMVALGPTIGIAAAQQLFLKQLSNNLMSYGIDATPFIQAGAVATPSVLRNSGDNIAHVIASYTDALDKVYLLTLIAGCVAFVAGLFVKLQKIPKQA